MLLGVTAASIVIEYSLTDECTLGSIQTRNAKPARFFDAATIEKIVRQTIGPVEIVNDQRRGQQLPPMSRQKVRWPTRIGHSHLLCSFNADGRLATATLVDTSGHQPSVKERSVAVRLSTLGTNKSKFVFRLEH